MICAGVLSVNLLTSGEAHHWLWKEILVDPARILRSDQPVKQESVQDIRVALGEPLTSWGGETEAKKSDQGRTSSKELGETAIEIVVYTESVQLTELCRKKRLTFVHKTARKTVAV